MAERIVINPLTRISGFMQVDVTIEKHNHGVFIGGITTQPTTDKIIRIKSILMKIGQFVENIMIPDAHIIAHYYNEYYKLGARYGNLLS